MKHLKRTLLVSVLAIALSIALLAGTTLAWFTDEVTNKGNVITTGNLTINAYAFDLTDTGSTGFTVDGVNGGQPFYFETDGQDLNTDPSPIIYENNWEPGMTSAKLLTVSNAGTVAAKIKLHFEVSGDLTPALWFDFVRVEGNNAAGSFTKRPMSTLATFAQNLTLPLVTTGDSVTFLLIYGMDTTANNTYQGKTFSVDVTILATQYNAESDGFGDSDYDQDAGFPAPYVLPEGVTIASFDDNSALAYADGIYYQDVADAVAEGGTIYLKPYSTTNLKGAHTPIPANGITLYANHATFNSDLAVDTYDQSASGGTDGIYDGVAEVDITVYNARNLYLWGQRNSDATVNITMKDCINVGGDTTPTAVSGAGRAVYLSGTKGITNITLNGVVVRGAESPVYSNQSGDITIEDSSFIQCAAPININYKATSGTQTVTVDNCSFVDCGADLQYTVGDGTLGDYDAPIRVVHSAEGSLHSLTVRNTSVTGTVSKNGDVLIGIHKGGSALVTATLENNSSDLRVDKGDRALITVTQGTAQTVTTVLA